MRRIPSKKPTLRNIFFTVLPLAIAAAICFVLQSIGSTKISTTYVPLLFVLAVLLVSRFTDSYVYGIAAAVLATFCVNYAFTYPYFALNFTITGYPLTFVILLAVAVSVSMLTTQIKHHEKIRAEIETEKMRANLLRAVSHDLRTPLTSIVGAAETYLDSGERISEARKAELIRGARDEAQWLVRVVENLLSVTRMNGGTAELLARIRAAIRHTRTASGNTQLAQSGLVTVGDLTIDYNKRRVFVAGQDANLTQNEFRLVALLGRSAGRAITYDTIIQQLWGPNVKNDNQILRVNMANIRRKIEKNPADPQYIFTEARVGYRMAEPDEPQK